MSGGGGCNRLACITDMQLKQGIGTYLQKKKVEVTLFLFSNLHTHTHRHTHTHTPKPIGAPKPVLIFYFFSALRNCAFAGGDWPVTN